MLKGSFSFLETVAGLLRPRVFQVSRPAHDLRNGWEKTTSVANDYLVMARDCQFHAIKLSKQRLYGHGALITNRGHDRQVSLPLENLDIEPLGGMSERCVTTCATCQFAHVPWCIKSSSACSSRCTTTRQARKDPGFRQHLSSAYRCGYVLDQVHMVGVSVFAVVPLAAKPWLRE